MSREEATSEEIDASIQLVKLRQRRELITGGIVIILAVIARYSGLFPDNVGIDLSNMVLAIGFIAIAWSNLFLIWSERRWAHWLRPDIQAGLELAVVVSFLLGLASVAAPYVPRLAALIAASAAAQHATFAVGAVTVSSALYLLRKFRRLVYGILEIFVALVGIIAYPLAPIAEEKISLASAAWGIGLMSLIYLIVRGLDNIDVARQDRIKRLVLSNPERSDEGERPEP